jgi:Fic family protein
VKSFKAGVLVNQGTYKSFEPTPINRPWKLDNMEIQQLLGQADRQLGRLDMYSDYVPNIDLFITMHVLKEATQSSRIEGTQTRIEEALLERDDIPAERRADWEEIQNYIEALDFAIAQLGKLPFSSRLIRGAHAVLMKGVRGQHKNPGEFRTSQNWIGGSSPSDAFFVPPVPGSVPPLMADLEQFVHNDDIFMPDLLRIGLVHYQFETIHPFLDGNGRVGRLLIPLYLVEKTILKRPVLYLSDYFERHRSDYYDSLTRVRTHHDLIQWFRFFLKGVIETAESGVRTLDRVLQLQKEVEARTRTLGARSARANRVIQAMYKRPVMSAARVAEAAQLSLPSTYRLITDLERLGILREITGAKRGRLFVFGDYISIFES